LEEIHEAHAHCRVELLGDGPGTRTVLPPQAQAGEQNSNLHGHDEIVRLFTETGLKNYRRIVTV
jgi:hypothetical protein